MANNPIQSKVVASQKLEKPILEAKNDFNPNSEYSMQNTITANGGKSDDGSFLEQKTRTTLFAKNIFSSGSEYTMPID